MANEFTLAGTFKDASNRPAYVGQYVVFRVTSVGTDTEDQVAYPRDSVSFLIDANGDFGGTMWLNGDSGTVCLYEILDPSGQRIEVVIPSSDEGATVRYEQIIENYQAGSASPQLPANEALFMRKANNLSDVSSVSTSRANLGLEIGTDVQAHSSILDATTASFTASKDTEISTNTANIATNAADIATNTAGVATNAADIADKAPIASPTFTGTATIPQADITSADFNSAGVGGELSWNDGEKTIDLTTGSDNVTVQLGQEVVLYVRNTTGSTVSNGQIVMVSGSQGNKPTISLAQADTVANARKTIGVLTQDIPNNSNGFITLIGKVRDLVLDDATYSEGDVVFLSSTVAGGITLVEPDISVEIGHVLATSSGGNTNGVIEVQINNGADLYNAQSQINTNSADISTNAAAIALNTAKVTNATHTGDVTGSDALTISSGAVDIDNLSATGSPSAITFLRGDNTWSVPVGSGSGDVASDAIWDAAGDLAVGTGTDTAVKLSIGTNGQVLTSNGTTATWASVNTGNGDMLASVYDPSSIAGNAFSMDNMVEGTNTKILTPTERSNIASNTAALSNLGPANAYPYTTDFQGGVAQTRDLSNIDNGDGYKNETTLTSIYIGSKVVSIDFQAFLGTSGLTEIKIPSTVTTIGQSAFAGSGLTSATIPDSITDMGVSSTFDGCLSLHTVVIGNNVPTIPIFGLANCPLLSSVSIGSGVTAIGASAFQSSTGLTSISIPSGVNSIGASAFNGCTSLGSISINAASAPTLGSNAFLNVSATTVEVPIGATGYSATYGGLTVVYV